MSLQARVFKPVVLLSVSVAAAAATMTQTGAFKSVDVHELLAQEQLNDALVIAKDISQVYKGGRRQRQHGGSGLGALMLAEVPLTQLPKIEA